MARPLYLLLLSLVFLNVASADETKLPPPDSKTIDFVRDIQPIFKSKCYSCHDGAKQRGGFRLDLKAAALKGGESFSPAIIPGKSADSPLIRVLAGLEEGLLMPPEGDRLTAQQIGLLRAWIDQGAKWPDSANVVDDVMSHWSFRPVVRKAIPTNAGAIGWARNPIDPFIIDRLRTESANLSPSVEADRRTLIRRLSFDLIGLPPTPDDVAEFVADQNPDAYERLVDRLLASPHFGERWARHWLDVARYADTKGYVFFQDKSFPWSWAYRDWVTQALSADMPYDRFIRAQLAADRLQASECGPGDLPALGFLTLGGRFMNNQHDIIDDRIDVVTRGLLGLTVSCARCHDHKFDPITLKDYYGMAGIFAGTRTINGRLGLSVFSNVNTVTLPETAEELKTRAEETAQYWAAVAEARKNLEAAKAAKAAKPAAKATKSAGRSLTKAAAKPAAKSELKTAARSTAKPVARRSTAKAQPSAAVRNPIRKSAASGTTVKPVAARKVAAKAKSSASSVARRMAKAVSRLSASAAAPAVTPSTPSSNGAGVLVGSP